MIFVLPLHFQIIALVWAVVTLWVQLSVKEQLNEVDVTLLCTHHPFQLAFLTMIIHNVVQ